MTRPYLGNPKYTIEVLQKYHFVFQKRFGQNFLIDTHVLDKIIDSAQITKDDFVLEIGPGIGTMTQYLADAAREVTAVEIDDALIPILQDTLKEWDNVSVIHGDILKTDIRKIADEKNQGRPIKVVANLPYYITTPIIMGLFICNNIIIQRFGIDEVKRIMTTSGIAYVVVGIIVSLLSLTINSDYVLTSNEVFNSLFGYDINNIRIFIGGFVSIMLMLWSSSYIYYYIRRSKNILWFSNIGTMLFIQMLESIIFVIISYIGEFDFTLLFGMIVIRYLIKIMIGMIGLIPVYTIVKMKDK